jgi:starch synthase (maltosyl-transferring)
MLVYEKATPDRSNVVLVAVSFDPHQAQQTAVELPLWRWGLPDNAALNAVDLLEDARVTWHGKRLALGVTPQAPYRLWRVRPAQ